MLPAIRRTGFSREEAGTYATFPSSEILLSRLKPVLRVSAKPANLFARRHIYFNLQISIFELLRNVRLPASFDPAVRR